MIRGWWAVALGLVAGSAIAGLLTGVIVGLVTILADLANEWSNGSPFLNALYAASSAAATFTPAFLTGMIMVGAPTWLLMHRAGRRSRKDAALVGAGLTMIVTLLLSLIGGLIGMVVGLFIAAGLALPGAAAGWIVHRVAYRPAATP